MQGKSNNIGHTLQNMRAIQKIRQSINKEVFNYTQVIDSLKDYKKPRDVINGLLKKGDLIRVKKGLYVFGDNWCREPYCKELLANLIYGPSVISCEYVLSNYGLIPEQAKTLTSITTGRSRKFETPLGNFSYKQLSNERFGFGLEIHEAGNSKYFTANPIKALADKIWFDKRFKPTSLKSYSSYLFDDLRIDEEILKNYIDLIFLEQLVKVYSARKINWLAEFLIKEFSLK